VAVLVQGKYITSGDLITRLNPTTYLAIFDDENSGELDMVDKASVTDVIESAEAEVDSYLITIRDLPLPAVAGVVGASNPARDRLLKMACLDFAQALAYERHPEYVRTYGDKSSKDSSVWKRAETRMQRIRAGSQELPDIDQQNTKPITIGGAVFDEGPRTIVTSADGTDNGGDF
jgi:hypothetical protein